MNVAVTVNDTYVYPLYIMLQTLFVHHKGIKIHIWLLHGGISSRNISMLREICEKNHNTLTDIQVGNVFDKAPTLLYFSKEMYFRMLLPWLIPHTEERILYLDPDLVVNDSLLEFYHTPLEGYCLAGCRDRLQDKERPEYRKFLGLREETPYINSGVLLFHLTELRKCFEVQIVYQMIKERGNQFKFPDQDVINLLFEGRIKLMEDRYNLNPNHLYAVEYLKYTLGTGRAPKPAVLHFMGKDKPWNGHYFKNLYHYYWYYERRYTNRGKLKLWLRIFRIPISVVNGYLYYAGAVFRRIGKAAGRQGDD